MPRLHNSEEWPLICRFTPSKDDLRVYLALQRTPDASSYPNASRWYNHIHKRLHERYVTALCRGLPAWSELPPPGSTVSALRQFCMLACSLMVRVHNHDLLLLSLVNPEPLGHNR